MSFRHKSEPQDIQASLDRMHMSLDEYGLNRDSTVLLGSCCLTCLHIRDPHDIDVMVSVADFTAMGASLLTPTGIPLEPKPARHQQWLQSIAPPSGIMPIDITRPTVYSGNDVVSENFFFRELANLPQTEEGWRFLTPKLSLAAMQSFHVRKNRKDIKQLKKIIAH